MPVPPIDAEADGEITLGLVAGRPGQELLEEQPEKVLYAVGQLARRLATVDLSLVAALDAAPEGSVLVHGDFGPQNLLLDPETAEPTALVDWEFAHIGDPVEDMAWAEWIVRTHHPDVVPALPALFEGFGVGAGLARTPRVDAREMPVASGLRPSLARSDQGRREALAGPTGRHRGLHPLTRSLRRSTGRWWRRRAEWAATRRAPAETSHGCNCQAASCWWWCQARVSS